MQNEPGWLMGRIAAMEGMLAGLEESIVERERRAAWEGSSMADTTVLPLQEFEDWVEKTRAEVEGLWEDLYREGLGGMETSKDFGFEALSEWNYAKEVMRRYQGLFCDSSRGWELRVSALRLLMELPEEMKAVADLLPAIQEIIGTEAEEAPVEDILRAMRGFRGESWIPILEGVVSRCQNERGRVQAVRRLVEVMDEPQARLVLEKVAGWPECSEQRIAESALRPGRRR
jgi:hypothetical protein